jgi:4-diphosphocytidyl-2-C-methyl-D-erythritol kinase
MLKNAISLYSMILFSPAKINIGLHILEKRDDGFHNIRSVIYPTGLCDILEIKVLPEGSKPFCLSQSGILIDADPENNLVSRAWRLLINETALPPVAIHLHKQIPVGAGLGGGSSNATYALKALNQLAQESLNRGRLEELAAWLGSDCPFFLHHGPMMMEGRGEILKQAEVNLAGSFLVLLFPRIHVSTAEAYAGVHPESPVFPLENLISRPVEHWADLIKNDFEESVSAKFPLIREMKNALYHEGAQYASMSGSGSSVYGIFSKYPRLPRELRKYVIWEGSA